MTSPWVDPLSFALGTLGGGGVALALWVGLRPAGGRGLVRTIDVGLALAALLAAGFATTAATLGQPVPVWGSALALSGGYLLLISATTPVLTSGLAVLARLAAMAGRPRGRRWVALMSGAACPFMAIGLVYSQCAYEPTLTDGELLAMAARDEDDAPYERNPSSPLTTDRGRTVPTLNARDAATGPTPPLLAAQRRLLDRWDLHDEVIHLPGGWQACNCHGFVFTGGSCWVPGDAVDLILTDNDYEPVTAVRPGDIAVYRGNDGKPVHTGVICGTTADGRPLVESKWGKLGRFIHTYGRSPYSESACTFYRSPRPGHLLRGAYPGSGDPGTPAAIGPA